MGDKNSPSSNGETTFIAIIGLFLIVKILDSFWLWTNKSPRNVLMVMGLLIVIMIPVGRILWIIEFGIDGYFDAPDKLLL